MKKIFWLLSLILGVSFVSCSEEAEVGEFEGNWEERNVNYLDSIATVARATQGNAEGQWKVIQSYHLSKDFTSTDNQDYVYAKIIKNGSGEISPIYSDSVSVSYRGRLIPTVSYKDGYVFDQSYTGDLYTFDSTTKSYVLNEDNIKIMVPSVFSASGVIVGWTTALQQMHVGDIWRVYIPQNLGYGSTAESSIPAYSTLVFDVYLQKITTQR